jgi:hypothetical protein
MKTINLEEILNKIIPYEGNYRSYNEDDILLAMRNACNQTVDLCANKFKDIDGMMHTIDYRNAILKIKEQII